MSSQPPRDQHSAQSEPSRPQRSTPPRAYDHQMPHASRDISAEPASASTTADAGKAALTLEDYDASSKRHWSWTTALRLRYARLTRDDNATSYTPDPMTNRALWISLFGSGLVAFVGSLAMWAILRGLTLPAYSTSNVLRGLATAGTAVVIVTVVAALLWWLADQYHHRPRPRWKQWLVLVITYLAPALLVCTTLSIPLAATNLYLGGISVDQEFRTQYLTRFTDSAQLSDMNYFDLPTFYPAAWFWLGGRFANVLGLAGWEAFQPWAIVSLSVVAALLTPLWHRLLGSLPMASAIAVANTVIVLLFGAEEPYAAVILLLAPAAVVIARRALVGSRLCMVAITLYLGVSAATYTLFTGVLAVSIVLMALVLCLFQRAGWASILRLGIIGCGSLALAAVAWAPYYKAKLTGNYEAHSAATRYLPNEGTVIPLPMFSFSLIGLLCLLGLFYLVVRRSVVDAQGLSIALVVCYGWVVASMVATVFGHSLLGFRLNGLIALLLATAGVLLLGDVRLFNVNQLPEVYENPRKAWNVTAIFLVVFALGICQYAQKIPVHHQREIDLAYSDTDPTGTRGTTYPADAGQYYAEIDEYLRDQGFIPRDTVVLTDEFEFMAYFPYRGFQALTAHYANPLGEFPQRNAQIEQWMEDSWSADSAQDFYEELHSSPWRGPDVLLLKANSTIGDDDSAGDASWSLDIAEDIFPNNPNVRWRALSLNPEVFRGTDSPWNVHQIGPFTVVSAKR